MSKQSRVAFEKWALSQGHKVCRHHLDHNDYAETSTFFMWNAYQQATAEANKRVEALEGEVAELKEVISISADGFEQLQASNNDLREALEKINECLLARGNTDEYILNITKAALSATPAESLQAFENEVIEKCAKVADECGTSEVAARLIRNLKQK